MKAETRTLQQVFHGDRRFIVPVYQRPYVWDEEKQWSPLWEDIEATAKRLAEARVDGHAKGLEAARADQWASPHFLGAIVIEQSPTATGEVETRLVVDGQQRLTTLQLLLRGVLDALEKFDAPRSVQARVRKAIRNDPDVVEPDQEFKVCPRPSETEEFLEAMDDEPRSSLDTPFASARRFFSEAASDFLSDDQLPEDPYGEGEPEQRRASLLAASLLGLVKIVVIDLDDIDDAQVIFEALNARNTPLSATDLVKNLLFMRALSKHDPQFLYDSLWSRFDEDGSWWREPVGVGHAQRPRQDWLLGDWLIAQLGRAINVGRLYGEFRSWLDAGERSPFEALETLNQYANAYEVLNSKRQGATPSELEAFAEIERLNITAATPVLLWLLVQPETVVSASERELAAQAIASFVVRRMAARYQTRGYGQTFVEVLKAAHAKPSRPAQAIIQALRSAPNKYQWPDSSEIAEQFASARYYGPGGINQDRIRLILGRIDRHLQSTRKKTEPLEFDYDGLQVEHIIPQDWRNCWAIEAIDSHERLALEHERELHLHRIGNLTLVHGSLNAALSNDPWEAKKVALTKHSKLELNSMLLGEPIWDEQKIVARGRWLAEQLDSVWPGPEAKQWDAS